MAASIGHSSIRKMPHCISTANGNLTLKLYWQTPKLFLLLLKNKMKKYLTTRAFILLAFLLVFSFQLISQEKVGINKVPNQTLDVNGNINADGNILIGGQGGSPGQVLGTNSLGASSWVNMHKFNNVTTFALPINTSTQWTVPSGVYLIYVELTGGGGGASFGAGGGGGSFASLYHQVTPGQIISYIVGEGGARAPSSLVAGASGNDTSISIGGNSYIAKGGTAGKGGPTGTPGSGGFIYDNDSYYSVMGQAGTANKTYYSYGPSGNTILTTEYGKGGGTYPQFLQNEGGFKSENVSTPTTLRIVLAPFPSSFGSGGASDNTMSMANNGERGVVRIFY